MAITRWNDPFRGLGTVHRDLDDIFSNLLNQSAAPVADSLPTMDVYTEDDRQLVAELHLPGFSPEDVEIRVQDDILEIRGERSEAVEDVNRGRSYIVRQSVASFYRRIVLPSNADKDRVDATFEDGVLRIVVPFTNQSNSRRVNVNGRSSGRKTSRAKTSRDTRSDSDEAQ